MRTLASLGTTLRTKLNMTYQSSSTVRLAGARPGLLFPFALVLGLNLMTWHRSASAGVELFEGRDRLAPSSSWRRTNVEASTVVEIGIGAITTATRTGTTTATRTGATTTATRTTAT